MKKRKTINIVSIVIISLTVLALVPQTILIKIKPGQTGVLNRQWGGGLAEKDFQPGYHWDLGPLHTWDIMDTRVQTLTMIDPRRHKVATSKGRRSRSRSAARLEQQGELMPPLQVKSAGGSTVSLDVTIKYRIKPGFAWKVLDQFGKSDEYKSKVRAEAIDIMRPTLGTLDNEQFYDPSKRKQITKTMQVDLQKRLDRVYIELISILIRDLSFDRSYEEQIKQKTLAGQDTELQIALAKAEQKKGLTRTIHAETNAKVAEIVADRGKTLAQLRAENDKKIRKIQADAEKYVVETRSEADLYASQMQAKGIKLTKDALARGEALRRQALAVNGGNIVVALETVKNIDLGEMQVSTQIVNPLDLDSILNMVGAKK